ncbi:hypothetical protein FEM48_Zijuj04G0186700 [Ziziphus jujuba var. spinosa]|uniref:non-specific serine/threonine protein kinase n=1 Tax=Ziziphus jujuba var. spinosa TaxID=714518 RepID=A0A978VLI8_ZIZJJ|nr:hypothetical protein FEM48_Zijuj04G0186700 [Ziziphus jujuba var. spinosa]
MEEIFDTLRRQAYGGETHTYVSHRLSIGSACIDYPFWGDGRPDGCGYPHLYLHCNKSQPTIDIMGVKYRVLDIDQNTQILHITRDDFSNDLLCSPTYPNTTFDLDQFEYAPDFEGVTLYYDCPPAVQGMAGYFNCTHRSTHKNGIIGNEPQTMGCNSSLRVGMRRSYFGVIWDLPKLAEALKEGFGLKYKVDTWLCSNCTKSGGACGYDMDSKQPTCYCADGSSGQRPCPLRKDVELGTDLGLLGVTTEEEKEIAMKMLLASLIIIFFSSFIFWLLLVTIRFRPCLSLDWFRSCINRFNCGNITGVDYPLSGYGRLEGCGYPHLHLDCNKSHPTINIMGVKYKELNLKRMWDFEPHSLDSSEFLPNPAELVVMTWIPSNQLATVQMEAHAVPHHHKLQAKMQKLPTQLL